MLFRNTSILSGLNTTGTQVSMEDTDKNPRKLIIEQQEWVITKPNSSVTLFTKILPNTLLEIKISKLPSNTQKSPFK